jgi:hypothetical protein
MRGEMRQKPQADGTSEPCIGATMTHAICSPSAQSATDRALADVLFTSTTRNLTKSNLRRIKNGFDLT